jgi:alkylated DNA repair dioxygenase AlkB
MQLFPTDPPYPSGFSYFPDFITPKDEDNLLTFIRSLALRPMIFQGFEAKRKVLSFGYDYSFDNRRLSKGKDIPHEFRPLLSHVAQECHVNADDFTELLVTEYPQGSVINWHRDAPPFELIAGISLLSDCTLKLRPHDKSKQSRSAVVSFHATRRSLYILQGSARSDWEHSIAPVKAPRYSITLRTLKQS